MCCEGDRMLLGAALKLLKRPSWGGGLARLGSPGQPLLCCAPAVDHVVPEPEGSLAEALERWREWADGKACCDYTLHVDIPRWSDRIRQELHTLVHEKGSWPATPRLALASPVPWPGRAVLSGTCEVLHSCQQELCPTGQLEGRVARAGSLTYPAHLSVLSALPQVLTPSWCTWLTRICTRCPTLR